MTKSNHDQHFTTSNTALAAYLQSLGYELLDIDRSEPFRCLFFFPDNDGLAEAAHKFELGTALGNIPSFYTSYKRLLKRVK